MGLEQFAPHVLGHAFGVVEQELCFYRHLRRLQPRFVLEEVRNFHPRRFERRLLFFLFKLNNNWRWLLLYYVHQCLWRQIFICLILIRIWILSKLFGHLGRDLDGCLPRLVVVNHQVKLCVVWRVFCWEILFLLDPA